MIIGYIAHTWKLSDADCINPERLEPLHGKFYSRGYASDGLSHHQ